MNDNTIKQLVQDKVKSLIQQFNTDFSGAFFPEVIFTKRGKVAGCVTYTTGVDPVINFNMTLLKENLEDFLNQTIPHEVAHFVTWIKYGHQYSTGGKRIIHGSDWKQMMQFFGVKSERCHSYNTANSTVRKLKRFTYKCSCQTHELTSIRHNKIQKGKGQYYCNKCKTQLTLV